MSLRHSYTLIAPFYDLLLDAASRPLRRQSLEALGKVSEEEILIAGIGTGLDIPYLPKGAHYTGNDITPAMLQRARRRAQGREDIVLEQADVMALPYDDNHFDTVIMHLILAVVPEPHRALMEAARVVKPLGRIIVVDKFLQPNERAWFKRLINPVISRIATRTDVVFEELLPHCPMLTLKEDRPLALGGWFRRIHLQKDA